MTKINIVIITFDSLRYDVAMNANTPNIRQLFSNVGVDGWNKAYAQATYTLPSHISMFQAGKLPENRKSKIPILDREVLAPFSISLLWERNRKALYNLPEAPNIVKGFEKEGYQTIGVGGVGWFNSDMVTSNIWKDQYFKEFYWNQDFHVNNPDSFRAQIDLIGRIFQNRDVTEPYFLFLNIASTHTPYMNYGRSQKGQERALEHVDSLFPQLINQLPGPCHYFLMADHGECFGEDGQWGHGFYHPKVMEVPFAQFIVN